MKRLVLILILMCASLGLKALETCLYYPFNIDIFLCDNQSEGFYKVRNH